MMKMIDRWFPCAEVSQASYESYGSGTTEKSLFTWFASRPVAQARAAVLTSMLPWPDTEAEQERLKDIVRQALSGTPLALKTAAEEVAKAYPEGARLLDMFSGRAIIPLEAARAGIEAWGIDYSPVATLAGMLLADFPFRDWTGEPTLPFDKQDDEAEQARFAPLTSKDKLAHDIRVFLNEIGRRIEEDMDSFYPLNKQGKRPWGYLWAQTMPCDECKLHFPILGSTVLAQPNTLQANPGFSFAIAADRTTREFEVVFREGAIEAPTLVSAKGKRGKVARCPFCSHTHTLDTVKARANSGLLCDKLLVVADHLSKGGYAFREPTPAELAAVASAEEALKVEKPFHTGVSAVPNEAIPPGNNHTVRASLYGAKTYGELCCARQTLNFIRLCRIISDFREELENSGFSEDYVRALLGYAGSVIVRKLRYSTRGATLRPARRGVDHIFKNQASLNYGFDFLETGIGTGSGTWASVAASTASIINRLSSGAIDTPARIRKGSALHLPFRPQTITAVVTDPPYDSMVDYSDASDLFFVWLKRALGSVFPELFDLQGVQEKDEEIIVKTMLPQVTIELSTSIYPHSRRHSRTLGLCFATMVL